MSDDIAMRLAVRTTEFMHRPMSAEVEEHLRRVVVDWFAAYWSGRDAPIVRALAQSGEGRDPLDEALRSGAAAHAAETDDIYAPGTYHPGAPVLAALFEVLSTTPMSGERFARAVIVGYEIGCLVAADLGPSHYEHWHTTGTVGGIGAAAAVAAAREGTADDIASAISIAATMASGLQGSFRGRADVKPLHSGHAASNGVLAARLALQGMRTSDQVLEGSTGMSKAMGGADTWENCQSAFEEPLAITRVTTKPYPCCGHSFAAIDAAREIRERMTAGQRGEIAWIRIETYRAAIQVAGDLMPEGPASARFSFPHAVAAVLLGLQPDKEMFLPQVIEQTAGLRSITRLSVSREFEAVFPSRRGARITVRLDDGTTCAATVPDRSGSPERPMNCEDLVEKMCAAAYTHLGTKATGELLGLLQELPALPSANRLSELARVGTQRPATSRVKGTQWISR